jgi:VanZ family protein
MALIFFLSAQPDLPHPESGWADLLFSSGSHAMEYGVLAVLLALALAGRRRAVLVSFLVTAFYALSDEFHQSFVPGRVPDPWDLACDVAGALVGLALWATWRRRASRSEKPQPQ